MIKNPIPNLPIPHNEKLRYNRLAFDLDRVFFDLLAKRLADPSENIKVARVTNDLEMLLEDWCQRKIESSLKPVREELDRALTLQQKYWKDWTAADNMLERVVKSLETAPDDESRLGVVAILVDEIKALRTPVAATEEETTPPEEKETGTLEPVADK